VAFVGSGVGSAAVGVGDVVATRLRAVRRTPTTGCVDPDWVAVTTDALVRVDVCTDVARTVAVRAGDGAADDGGQMPA
jgi:hypothetical protein